MATAANEDTKVRRVRLVVMFASRFYKAEELACLLCRSRAQGCTQDVAKTTKNRIEQSNPIVS
jgi:hypothetical protein